MAAPWISVTTWRIAAAAAPTYEGQVVTRSELSIVGVPEARVGRFTEHSPLQQPYLEAEYSVSDQAQRNTATARSAYEATLFAVTLEKGKPEKTVKPLTATERAAYLGVTEETNHQSPAFLSWVQDAGLVKMNDENELAFAYRVNKFIAQNFHYRWIQGSSIDPASVALNGASHCGGIANLFVATLRANGIPARQVSGRIVKKSSDENSTVTNGALTVDPNRLHAATEFYANGVGWVPAEPTGAIGSKDISRFFGISDGSLLVMSFDWLRIDEKCRSLQTTEFRSGAAYGSWDNWHMDDYMVVQQEVLRGDAKSPPAKSKR